MMALSMVVITALIGAPGLGRNVLQALQKGHVGEAFDAGLAIVILAIVLDRLTDHAGQWMDPRMRSVDAGVRSRRWLYGVLFVVVVGAIIFAQSLPDATAFPKALTFSFREPIDAIAGWVTTNLFFLDERLQGLHDVRPDQSARDGPDQRPVVARDGRDRRPGVVDLRAQVGRASPPPASSCSCWRRSGSTPCRP